MLKHQELKYLLFRPAFVFQKISAGYRLAEEPRKEGG
jgi:hypothetical protein